MTTDNQQTELTETPDLYLGLGNIVYAMAKVDGRIQGEETLIVRELLGQQPYGDLALHAFFLLENCDVPVEEAYAFAMRRFTNNRSSLTEPIKKQFITILQQVAESYDQTSRKEHELIKRFRRELRRL